MRCKSFAFSNGTAASLEAIMTSMNSWSRLLMCLSKAPSLDQSQVSLTTCFCLTFETPFIVPTRKDIANTWCLGSDTIRKARASKNAHNLLGLFLTAFKGFSGFSGTGSARPVPDLSTTLERKAMRDSRVLYHGPPEE